MSIPRVYFPFPLQSGNLISLDEATSRHLLTVLRLRTGESLQIFNGEGGYYSAKLDSLQKKQALVLVEDFHASQRESPIEIHLGQAISRGERMDLVMQKSVELGVAKITPLMTERCGAPMKGERSDNRIQRWQKIVISAVEQCGRCQVPPVYPAETLTQFLAKAEGLKLICSFTASQIELAKTTLSDGKVTLLIGPEGGFSPSEIQQAQQAGFHPLSLGPRILRTETAAIVALSVIQHHLGDLI